MSEQEHTHVTKRCQLVAALAVSIAALMLGLAFATGTALAQDGPGGRTYFVPLSETQMRASLDALYNPGATPPNYNIMSVVSIVPVANSTVVTTIIYYDHWEDGYEVDIEKPTQATTQVWGDNDPANGFPPGYPTDPGLNAGDVIALENAVFVNPRDPADILYDGGDKFFATYQVAVSRAEWAEQPGTILAGAVEVYDTSKYGTRFDVPVGEDLTNDMFEYVSLFVMAQYDGTVVEIDTDGDTIPDVTHTLNQGGSLHVDGGILTGGSVTTNMPVQADLVTGDVNPADTGWGELRWYALWPTGLWGDSYYSAVGGQAGNDTDVWVFNPNPTDIIVTAETLMGPATLTVPAGDVYRYTMPQDSGAHFYTGDGSTFFAMATVDSDSVVWDWGFTLLPERGLSPVALVGWGPGYDFGYSGGPYDNRSPVWVTAVSTTTIYVDYDGDPSTGPLTDPNGNYYDVAYPVSLFESVRVYDDSDDDQTGMRLYTVDGTLISAVWGEEMGSGHTGNPYLDMGTSVVPMPGIWTQKEALLSNDLNGNGLVDPGDTLAYTITTWNMGTGVASSVVVSATVSDVFSSNASYVPGSTHLDDGTGPPTQIPDDPPPATAFPLDGGGYLIGDVIAGSPTCITFEVIVNDPFEIGPAGCSVVNGIGVGSNVGSGGDWVMTPVTVTLDLDMVKTVEPAAAWEPFTHTLHVTNNGPMTATLTLTDTLPPDHFYVVGSGVPTDPDAIPGPTLVWQNIGPVDADDSLTVTYQVTVTPEISATFFSTATVYGVCLCGVGTASAEVPTAVELLYFRVGDVSGHTVRLEWATAVEVDNFGFNLYRAPVPDRSRASLVAFIPSQVHGGGATYAYTDAVPTDGLWWYWLADVDTSGGEAFHEPVSTVVEAASWPWRFYLPVVMR